MKSLFLPKFVSTVFFWNSTWACLRLNLSMCDEFERAESCTNVDKKPALKNGAFKVKKFIRKDFWIKLYY